MRQKDRSETLQSYEWVVFHYFLPKIATISNPKVNIKLSASKILIMKWSTF